MLAGENSNRLHKEEVQPMNPDDNNMEEEDGVEDAEDDETSADMVDSFMDSQLDKDAPEEDEG